MDNTRTASFYNTIRLKARQLYEAELKNEYQTTQILEFMKANKKYDWTPYEVWCMMPWMLLTSIRRSLTTLTKRGYLIHQEKQRPGGYGSPNDTWKYKTKRKNKY